MSISAPVYSDRSRTSARRRRLSWYVPSLVCHLFAQFSMNASTSDCATASLSDRQLLDVIDERFTVRFVACHPLFTCLPPCLDLFESSPTILLFIIRVCAVASGNPVKEQSIQAFFGFSSGCFDVHSVPLALPTLNWLPSTNASSSSSQKTRLLTLSTDTTVAPGKDHCLIFVKTT